MENTFLSTLVRIQDDRQQHVISTFSAVHARCLTTLDCPSRQGDCICPFLDVRSHKKGGWGCEGGALLHLHTPFSLPGGSKRLRCVYPEHPAISYCVNLTPMIKFKP
jgi:hypothetical protein